MSPKRTTYYSPGQLTDIFISHDFKYSRIVTEPLSNEDGEIIQRLKMYIFTRQLPITLRKILLAHEFLMRWSVRMKGPVL